MNWKIILYSDGGNPYICKTERELDRLKRKYGKSMARIGGNKWLVYVPEQTFTW